MEERLINILVTESISLTTPVGLSSTITQAAQTPFLAEQRVIDQESLVVLRGRMLSVVHATTCAGIHP